MSDIIKQLKDLRQDVKPRDEWVTHKRDLLVSQISSQTTQKKSSYAMNSWYLTKSFMPGGVMKFVARPVGVLTLLALFVFGSGMLSVNASKGSLPGDFLYPVKLTSEKVKVGLTVSKERKAELHVDFAGERVNEIETVLVVEKEVSEQEQKIKIAVDELKKDLQKAQDSMEESMNTTDDSEKAVASAMEIDKKTEEINVKIALNLEEVKENKELTKDLKEAELATTKTSVVAVEVMIDKHESGEVELSEVELVEVITKKIDNAEKKVQEVSETAKSAIEVIEKNELLDQIAEDEAIEEQELVDSEAAESEFSEDGEDVSGDEVGSESVADLETEVATAEEVADQQIKDDIEDKPEEAEQAITDAKELLSQGDLTSAIEKMKESTVLVEELKETAEKVVEDDILENPPVEETIVEEEVEAQEDDEEELINNEE